MLLSVSPLKRRCKPEGGSLRAEISEAVMSLFSPTPLHTEKQSGWFGCSSTAANYRAEFWTTALQQSDESLKANEEHSCFLQLPINNQNEMKLMRQ